jgi:hypothetical protein
MIESILSGLSNVKKYSSNRWQASCPAHDNRNPSMSITLGKGKVLFHCHAGCRQEDVIEALDERGLWPKSNGASAVTATYHYQKADGTHAYDINRVERPGQKKQFFMDPKGYPNKYLYRLSKVLKSKSVVVVEGEKDVATVERLGLVGTTNFKFCRSNPERGFLY